MTTSINDTHDPNLKSWVESANDPNTDFPIQNLAFCVLRRASDEWAGPKIGVRIGDMVLDVDALMTARILDEIGNLADEGPDGADIAAYYLELGPLNSLASADWGRFNNAEAWARLGSAGALRRTLSAVLRADNAILRDNKPVLDEALKPITDVPILMPFGIHNYTDFYASIHHAANVGSMFRPDNPLLPNYRHVPIGYHGRASSIVVSGADIKRPRGQQSPPDDNPGAGPSFGPCRMLDYELELGAFVGPGNALGEPIPISRAREHIFGLCLLNDWSARDIQKWEYQPLGPFLAKNFATTISPYVVTLEALEPFRIPAEARPPGDPRPLDYLYDEGDQRAGGFDITLEVYLQSAEMAGRALSPLLLSRGNSRHLYWTFAQMLAHHTSNGCNMQPGDLIGSGTISGPAPESRGCLLELTWQGVGPDKKPLARKPIELPTGEKRTFLADGDTVIFKGYCEREGFRRIGFGECRGTIVG